LLESPEEKTRLYSRFMRERRSLHLTMEPGQRLVLLHEAQYMPGLTYSQGPHNHGLQATHNSGAALAVVGA
jgi:hypothetical protein